MNVLNQHTRVKDSYFFNQLSEEAREADDICMEILSPPPARRFCSNIELDKVSFSHN